IGDDSPELKSIANYLANKLRPATGFNLPVAIASGAPAKGSILLTRSGADTKSGEEGYELAVTTSQLKLMATRPAGLFRGVQTIRQLLPAAVESSGLQKAVKWIVPT